MDAEREQEKHLLDELLGSRPWTDFLMKYVQKFKEADTLNLSMVRKADSGPPDDFLRGRIDVFNFLLVGLQRQLDEWNNPADNSSTTRPSDDSLPGTGDPYSESTSQGE